MRAVRTQFDVGEFKGTVATPTCCSCCCCCCCVTTFATASIVGAGAAVVVGHRARRTWRTTLCCLLLAAVAPGSLVLPFLAALVIPVSSEVIPLLVAGVILTWALYQTLTIMLRHRFPGRAALGMMVVLYMFGLLEAVVMFHFFSPYAIGDLPGGEQVFWIYVAGAIGVGTGVGSLLFAMRASRNAVVAVAAGRALPRRDDGPVGDGGGPVG